MSTPSQNRLVGTIIVAAAAIIFLPDIFDGEKQAYQAQFESIPASPDAVTRLETKQFDQQKLDQLNANKPLSIDVALDNDDELVIAKPIATSQAVVKETVKNTTGETSKVSNSKVTTNKATKSKISAAKNESVNAIPIKTVAKTVDKSKAYVIQLGSFKHKKNVQQLLTKLKKSGYTVYTKPIKTAAGNLTKVFIGPEISESSLQAKLPKLKQLTGVQGRVAIYQAID